MNRLAACLLLPLLSACAQPAPPVAEVAPAPPPAAAVPDVTLPVVERTPTVAETAVAVVDTAPSAPAPVAVADAARAAIRLADPARALDREAARQAVRGVDGVRSVVWIDRENLLIIVDSAQARTYATIDAVCLALEPLGDTLGVVVSLQNGEAGNGDELEILGRNCQLPPGESALGSTPRQIDVIDPEIRRQHRAAQALAEQSDEDKARQEESLQVLERNTLPVDE